mmetsp:Transcript_106712/g.184066  ORF Transcript_106712/g.184066 Transcript_106712/m.184066 type:complete len:107 (+) Transcript_106712:107-427(+)
MTTDPQGGGVPFWGSPINRLKPPPHPPGVVVACTKKRPREDHISLSQNRVQHYHGTDVHNITHGLKTLVRTTAHCSWCYQQTSPLSFSGVCSSSTIARSTLGAVLR